MNVLLDRTLLSHPKAAHSVARLQRYYSVELYDMPPDAILVSPSAIRCRPDDSPNAFAAVEAMLNIHAGRPYDDVGEVVVPNARGGTSPRITSSSSENP